MLKLKSNSIRYNCFQDRIMVIHGLKIRNDSSSGHMQQSQNNIRNMSWSTVYIHGKSGFKKALEDRLDDHWLQGNSEAGSELVMYWLEEDVSLRDFKLAIGSKTIFKYRLRFYTTVDEYLNEKNKHQYFGLSAEENSMVRNMVNWQKRTRKPNQLLFTSKAKQPV